MILGSTYSPKTLKMKKHFFLNCQNFGVTVRPLNIDKFLRNLTQRVFVRSLQLEPR